MPESTSTLLQLLMMVTGERNNDWGEQNNANLTKLENAIAGLEAVASTGGTSTLTADQARDAILNFTGSLASAHIVVVPNLAKSWIVRNGHTLAAYALTMKTSSGTAITIPTGSHLVFCDGGDNLYRIGFSTIANSDLNTMAAATVKANIAGDTANPTDVALADFIAALSGALLGAQLGAGSVAYSKLATAAIATAAEIWGKTASKLIDADKAWEAAEYVALTSGTSIAINMGAGVNFSLTLGHNGTLATPTNAKEGQAGVIVVTQDGTGGRTLSFDTGYVSTGDLTVTVDTTAGRVTVLTYLVLPGGLVWISAAKGVR